MEGRNLSELAFNKKTFRGAKIARFVTKIENELDVVIEAYSSKNSLMSVYKGDDLASLEGRIEGLRQAKSIVVRAFASEFEN